MAERDTGAHDRLFLTICGGGWPVVIDSAAVTAVR